MVFGLLLYLARRYAWGPITKALEEREANIATSLEKAAAAMEEAQHLKAQNDQSRQKAEHEARRLLRDAREDAERVRSAELQRTREEINAMRLKALEEIERDKQVALKALRSEVAELAVLAAEQILREELDMARQGRLVDRFLDGFSRN